jgi:hypothetical protein
MLNSLPGFFRWHVPPKRRLIFNGMDDVTTQTLELFCTYTLDTPRTAHNLERGAVSRFPMKWMDTDHTLICNGVLVSPRPVRGGVKSDNALLVRLMTGCDVWQDNCIATLMCIWFLYVLIIVQLRGTSCSITAICVDKGALYFHSIDLCQHRRLSDVNMISDETSVEFYQYTRPNIPGDSAAFWNI